MMRIEAGIYVSNTNKAANKQPRANREYDTKGDLGNDE